MRAQVPSTFLKTFLLNHALKTSCHVYVAMKFAKTLEAIRQQFHNENLRATCLPYKTWKKQLKYGAIASDQEAFKNLEEQYCTVHRVCKSYIAKSHSRWSCCRTTSRVHAYEEADFFRELLAYIEINLQALYKICKKLEKNGHAGFMEHYQSLRSKRTIALGYLAAKLRLVTDPTFASECPICMSEVTPQDTRVILKCGHVYCFDCVQQMMRLDTIHATLINKLAIASRVWTCPICRMRDPIPEDIPKAFYPAIPQLSPP